jgi:hypothetical protein
MREYNFRTDNSDIALKSKVSPNKHSEANKKRLPEINKN